MTCRIGLYGGSFDPPHNAHLALARQARDQLALDELRLVPAGDPWQKTGRLVAPAAERAAMLKLATAAEPRMVVDECELQRPGPTYTLDTVLALQSRPGMEGAEWFLVMGQDQYARLHTWHRWQALLGLVTLAVAGRAGELPQPSAALAALPHRWVALDLPPMALSATNVRERLARGESIENMVPAAVAGYIAQAHLYKS